MGAVGNVRIGHKAPYFHCEAVCKGVIEEVTLNTYIRPSAKPSDTPDPAAPWLIILFIPAAFSFVCPTEVLAFQNCLDEFKDRNCNIVFVSVDTKHSLWHWQNVPRQYGGLGDIDIPLLSDANHRIARDYGVLIEEQGVSLRGMFIVDGEGIVQQITLNNLTVGRSVLEALRLLEAFQAVAKHGVLCPVDWKPSGNTADTISTISNMLTESYDERLANLQKEFGDVQVTDLDAKHGADTPGSRIVDPFTDNAKNQASAANSPNTERPTRARSQSSPSPVVLQEVSCNRPKQASHSRSKDDDCLPQLRTSSSDLSSQVISNETTLAKTAPVSSSATPAPSPASPTSSKLAPPPFIRTGTARHNRGTGRPSQLDHRGLSNMFTQSAPSPSLFTTLVRSFSSNSTDSSSDHSSAPPTPLHIKPTVTTPITAIQSPAATTFPPAQSQHNMYESRRGSQVVLEFADPTTMTSRPTLTHSQSTPGNPQHPHSSYTRQYMAPPPFHTSRGSMPPSLNRSRSWTGPPPSAFTKARIPGLFTSESSGSANSAPASAANTPGQSRLQATFEALKKMGGMASPKPDAGGKKGAKLIRDGSSSDGGYFHSVEETAET